MLSKKMDGTELFEANRIFSIKDGLIKFEANDQSYGIHEMYIYASANAGNPIFGGFINIRVGRKCSPIFFAK